MNYIIRKKERNDCYSVANVVVKAWKETYRGLIPDDYLDSLNVQKISQHNYEDFNEKDNHQFVLEVNNEIVGFVNVGSSEEKDYDNCGEIHALYIIKDYQKNGYGKLLIEAGIKELKNIDIKVNYMHSDIKALDSFSCSSFSSKYPVSL